jgi:hypothetical protein
MLSPLEIKLTFNVVMFALVPVRPERVSSGEQRGYMCVVARSVTVNVLLSHG